MWVSVGIGFSEVYVDMVNCLRVVEEFSVRFRKVLRCSGCVCFDGVGVVRGCGSVCFRGGLFFGFYIFEGFRFIVRVSEAFFDCFVVFRF